MTKGRVDHTGEVIGELTCIKKSEICTKAGNYKYLYKCSCGNEKLSVRGNLIKSIKNGKSVSCGCKSKPPHKDITGVKKNKLTAIENTWVKCSNGDYIWKFKCDCGVTCETSIGRFNSGHTKSCGCVIFDTWKEKPDYHGLRGTKTYQSWRKIKERCFDENDSNYERYGSKGITMSDEFRSSFQTFYDYIGEPPDDGKRYSVDRIDNSGNYERGNIRWATDHQQARNKGMQKNNSSGIKGVAIDNKGTKDKPYLYAKCQWHDFDGVIRSKSFSFKTYGEELAMFLAQEYRILMLERLNSLGAGYTHQHIYGEPE